MGLGRWNNLIFKWKKIWILTGCYLEGLNLLVVAQKSCWQLALIWDHQGWIFIRQYERESNMPDRWVSQCLTSWTFAWESAHPLLYFLLNNTLHWKLYLCNLNHLSLQSVVSHEAIFWKSSQGIFLSEVAYHHILPSYCLLCSSKKNDTLQRISCFGNSLRWASTSYQWPWCP